MSIAFGDDEEIEPEIRNTEAVEEEIDFLLDEEEINQSKYAWLFWVLLSSACFAVSNLMINELGKESYQVQALYYNSGGLVVSLLFCQFAHQIRKARALHTGKFYRKLLFDPETRKCDYQMVLLILFAAGNQALVLAAIAVNFRIANAVGLNIGIAMVFWSLNLLLQSCVDCKCIQWNRVIGFLLLIACTELIFLSKSVTEQTKAGYQATIVSSITVAFTLLCGQLIARQALVEKKVNPLEYYQALFGLLFFISQVLAAVYFIDQQSSFDSMLWLKGFAGSACNLLGFSFFMLAIDTHKEVDLIFAWNLTTQVIVLLAVSVLTWTVPDWMQLVGFFVGLIGSLALIMPDLISRLWITVTCQTGEEEVEEGLALSVKSEDSFDLPTKAQIPTTFINAKRKAELSTNLSIFSD